VSAIPVIAGYAIRESVRRKVFVVLLVLTLLFLGLYAFGTHQAFRDTSGFGGVARGLDTRVIAGATVFGLSMFATLFLGSVLAVFLTLGAIRGDAEQGLLQPLVVRPVGRSTLLVARYLGAASVAVVYTILVYAASLVITGIAGDWWPDHIVTPALELAGGVAIVTAISLLGSVFLSPVANGIAVFMVFGAGLVAGLLGQIGHAIGSHTLRTVARVASWVVPFEALYQDGLHALTSGTTGFTRFALELGPFGGAQVGGDLLGAWSVVYVLLIGGAALAAFNRRDL
jgi:ABC-type transport system involved in multi-copper enzyme maturation permease subunit